MLITTRLQTRPSGAITSASWAELRTFDTAAAKLFYSDLFGWGYYDQPMPDGPHFSVAMADGRPVAVIAPAVTAQHQPPAWISHRGVNDLDSYSVFLIDGVPLVGIATADRAKPATASLVSFAVVSFAVVDTDEAVVRVTTLGGRSLMDPIEMPTGRICRVADSQGAAFDVLQPRHPDSRMDGNGRQPDGQDQFG